MGHRKRVRAPTSVPILDSVRVPSTTQSLVKCLSRLSKDTLIDLALEWLQEENRVACEPYLACNRTTDENEEEDYLWEPAGSVEELRLEYNRMKADFLIYRRHVVDRILDGDWRRGLSLYQIATLDTCYLSENDNALRWTALRIVPCDKEESGSEIRPVKKRRPNPAPYPTLSPTTFLRNLQTGVAPLVKAHYSLQRTKSHPDLSIIRICITESPYGNPLPPSKASNVYTDFTRLIFIALPDSCPFIYISVAGQAGSAIVKQKAPSARQDLVSLKRAVLEEVPRALGKSHHRYSLESTSLTARSLMAIKTLRGNAGTNGANGVYTIFAHNVIDNSPVDSENLTFAQKVMQACAADDSKPLLASTPPSVPDDGTDDRAILKEKSNNALSVRVSCLDPDPANLKAAVAARFGVASLPQTKERSTLQEATVKDALDRVQIRLDEDLCFQGQVAMDSKGSSQNFLVPDQAQPSSEQSTGRTTLTFVGGNVFLGLRKLAEFGRIDTQRMPAWLTGEESISGATIRKGVCLRGQGSGL